MRDTIENIRLVATSCLSYAFGWLMPTKGFVLALVLTFAFNCWAGMRADGVSIARCKNFSFSKFKNALVEILLYRHNDELRRQQGCAGDGQERDLCVHIRVSSKFV